MNKLSQSLHSFIGRKITGILLSTTLLASAVTGLGAAVLPSAELTVTAAGSYGLPDKIQDGNILHCFCWKYDDITAMLPEIAEAGFTSIQTSPPQATAGTGAWWWFYQPLGFYIGSNAMGNKDSLARLCSEADKYGIKIIADVVANHLAGDHSNIQNDLKDGQFWHQGDYSADDGDRYRVTHGRIGMPDLNTEHSYVQQCVVKYIQELKSVGVDGIRFDAAKHIGLPSEGDQFWPTVTGADQNMWYYGEILNNPGLSFEEDSGQRSQAIAVMQEYAKYIGITDSIYGMTLRNSFNEGKVPLDFGCYAGKWISIPNNRLVYWGESHDTWSNNQEWGYSNHMDQNTIDRAYAIAASRNGITALYFSRPSSTVKDDIHIGAKGSTHFTSKEVAAVNHFKNALNGENDYYTTGDNCAVVCRPSGAVIVLGSGSDRDVSVPNGGGTTKPGTYTDEITGSTWTVTADRITGHIGSSGIAVVYNAKQNPPSGSVSLSPTGGSFTDTLSVTLTANNITNAAYKTSEGASGSFSGSKTITIGAATPAGGTVTVTVSGTKPDGSAASASGTYTKKDPKAAVTINVDNSVGNWNNVYAYVYTGEGTTAKEVAPWPGVKMTKGSQYYTLDVSGYENGRVIFSDGTNNASCRYPADMQPGLSIGGQSMLFTMPNQWVPLPAPTPKLSVSLSASPSSVTVGSPVTLKAVPSHASGNISYTFKAGNTVIASSGATASYTPIAAGTVTFTVTASAANGTATASAAVTVKNKPTPVKTLVNNSTVSSTNINFGSGITISGKASGGTTPYQYGYYYKKSTDSSYKTLKGYSSAASVKFTPSAATAYDIKVKVKDANGTIKAKIFTVKVTPASASLTNKSTLSAVSIKLGSKVTVNGAAAGGTKPYQYQVSYKKKSSDKYTVLQSYKTNAAVTFQPAAATTYDVLVSVKDKNNNVVKKQLTLTVTNPLKNTSTVSATSITLGKSLTISGKASGGTAPYQYAAFCKKSTASSYTTLRSYSKTAVITFKPAAAVSYNLLVKVKDSKGAVVSKTFNIKVTKADAATTLTNKSTLSSASVKLGSKVTVTCAAAGGKTPYQYFVNYRKSTSDNAVTLQKYSTNKTVSFKPSAATTYIVRVKVRDAAGTVKTKDLTLTVKK